MPAPTVEPLIYLPPVRARLRAAVEALGGARPAALAAGVARSTLLSWLGRTLHGRSGPAAYADRARVGRLLGAAALQSGTKEIPESP